MRKYAAEAPNQQPTTRHTPRKLPPTHGHVAPAPHSFGCCNSNTPSQPTAATRRLLAGVGAAIGQVWTRHCRSSRACPMAFIALSVHHVFVWPLALLVFQTAPGPCLPGWGQSCGPRVLSFTAWGHYSHDNESGSWRVCGVPYLGCLYLGCACLRWPLLATHPWVCGFPRSWRARGARGQKLAGLVAATNPGKSWRSLGLISPTGYWLV